MTAGAMVRRKLRVDVMTENRYATDGKCHNAQPGTYGHECGKPALWIGTNSNGFSSGFCDACAKHGYEARGCTFQLVSTYRAPGSTRPTCSSHGER
jgi:hypothetical protein